MDSETFSRVMQAGALTFEQKNPVYYPEITPDSIEQENRQKRLGGIIERVSDNNLASEIRLKNLRDEIQRMMKDVRPKSTLSSI